MITSLTLEQIVQLEIYRKKWLDIGLATDRINKLSATERWHRFSKEILRIKNPTPIIFLESPYATWMTFCFLYIKGQINKKFCWNYVKTQLWNQIEYPLWRTSNRIEEKVWEQISHNKSIISVISNTIVNQINIQKFWKQIDKQLWKQVNDMSELWVRRCIDKQAWEHINSICNHRSKPQDWLQIQKQANRELDVFIPPYCNFTFWVNYFSSYDYINKVLGIKFPNQKRWDMLISLADLPWVYPLENLTIISEKPTEIHIKNGVLHNEKGMAIKYADGFGAYVLNGVVVSEHIVMTRDVDLNPKLILTEKNAEVRREIVRKIGIERVCLKLNAKVLDKKGDYELLNLDLGDGRMRPYLKMRNPSIHTWHVEGVPPEIKTVEEALNWRNQSTEMPEILV